MSDNHVQVLLYTSYLHIIGGIETFIYNFIEVMYPYYDIGLLCPQLPPEVDVRIGNKIPVYGNQDKIDADTLIMIRMMDAIPKNVTYKHSIRMCHATKSNPSWEIKKDCDTIVNVSNASKDSFKSNGIVIYNPLVKSTKKALLLVSATRIPATDKGRNADRMLQLAKMLNDAHIPFLWFNFSDAPLRNAPKGFYNVGTYQELQPYISRADYLVQLSDQEGFGYSVAEALIQHTAVICTPFATTQELGVIDGVNGYIIPFSMDFDVHKLLDVPEFDYEYDNDTIIQQWRDLLGKKKPTHKYNPSSRVIVEIMMDYRYIQLNRYMKPHELHRMTSDRAKELQDKGLVKIINTIC